MFAADTIQSVFSIPTIVGYRPRPAVSDESASVRRRVLRSLPRIRHQLSPAPPYPLQDFKALYKCCIIIVIFKVGVFNAQSATNKAASIADWISSESLSLAAVTETWHDGFDSPSLVACTPDGYSYVEQARPREHTSSMRSNYGGVCLFHCCRLRVSRVTLPSSASARLSFYTDLEAKRSVTDFSPNLPTY